MKVAGIPIAFFGGIGAAVTMMTSAFAAAWALSQPGVVGPPT